MGNPASKAVRRAMLTPCSLTCVTHPTITSSTLALSMPVRLTELQARGRAIDRDAFRGKRHETTNRSADSINDYGFCHLTTPHSLSQYHLR